MDRTAQNANLRGRSRAPLGLHSWQWRRSVALGSISQTVQLQTKGAQQQTRLLQKELEDLDLTNIAAVLRASSSKQLRMSATADLLQEHSGLDVQQFRGLNDGLRKAVPHEAIAEVKPVPTATGPAPFASATYRQQQQQQISQQQAGGAWLPPISESLSLRFSLYIIALIITTIGCSILVDQLFDAFEEEAKRSQK